MRTEPLAAALLASTAELELEQSVLRLGRVGDRSLDVRLLELPPNAQVRLRAERVEPSLNVTLIVEHGEARIELELVAKALLSYAKRLAVTTDEKPGPCIARRSPPPSSPIVRVTENDLRRHFRKSEHVFKQLTQKLGAGRADPPAVGDTAEVDGVTFTAVVGSPREATWSFADDDATLKAVAALVGSNLLAGERPPWLASDEVAVDEDWNVKNARFLLPYLFSRLGRPHDYPGRELVLANRDVAVRFFKRRVRSGGKPSIVWAYRPDAAEALQLWGRHLSTASPRPSVAPSA